MVKLNFEKMPCYVDIRKQAKMELDIKFEFANTMYKSGAGVAIGALALKIYNSNDATEYNEQECNIILEFASSMNPFIYDSIKEAIGEQTDESK